MEVGPRFDFVVRRTREPPTELQTAAFKQPTPKKKVHLSPSRSVTDARPTQEKNVKLDTLYNKVGAVYVPNQPVDKIITARHKV